MLFTEGLKYQILKYFVKLPLRHSMELFGKKKNKPTQKTRDIDIQ